MCNFFTHFKANFKFFRFSFFWRWRNTCEYI
jgi:hypothetical protein